MSFSGELSLTYSGSVYGAKEAARKAGRMPVLQKGRHVCEAIS
jgi:hypothetical protein